MKTNPKKYYMFILFVFTILGLTSCEDKKEWSENYDIEWPVSTIENVQPMSAAPEAVITITGKNLHLTGQLYIGDFACKVITMTETQLTVEVPERVTEASEVSVSNTFRRTFIYKQGLFVPIIND